RVRKRLVEHRDVDAVGDFGPVGDRERHIEIVVEDCTAQPRHGRSVGGEDDGRKRPSGRSPWLRAIRDGASGQIAFSSEVEAGSREENASKNGAAGQAQITGKA